MGAAEIATGLLLIAAAGGWQAVRAFRFAARPAWERAGQALLFYGLTVPVIAGLFNGAGASLMLRDLIPFLFFLLPLFLPPFADRRAATAAVAAAGFLFAARVMLPLLAQRSGLHLPPPSDPFYLANAPTVLFCALLLAGLAGRALYEGASAGNLLRAGALFAAALVPLAAMILITQRASIGIMILSGLFLLAAALVRNPVRTLLPLLAAAILLWAGWDLAAAVGQDVARKTAAVGLNMRWNEARAVLDELDGSFPGALFGRGWGAAFASPATGGAVVNFTHSLITSYLLKTGLCGLALALIYLACLGLRLARLLPVRPVLAVAIAGPVLIDIFLYASFKSLDFGLVLLLIPLWERKLHNDPAPDMLPAIQNTN